MSLELYRERVETLALRRDGEPVFNGSPEHAAIIVEHMFAHAHDHIQILSGKLNARVYGPDEVIEQARLFLAEPSHRLQILLEDAENANLRDHPFFDAFCKNENMEIRRVPTSKLSTYDFHFLVMDADSYRFEEDKTSCAAIAAFGHKEGGTHLEEIFAPLWETGERVDLPQNAAT